MNLIKSLFIVIIPLWHFYIGYYAIVSLISYDEDRLRFFALLLSSMPLLLFLSLLILYGKWARTSRHLFAMTLPSFIGFIIVMILFFINHGIQHSISLMMAMSTFITTFLYVYWYSDNQRLVSSELKNKNRLPNFTVKDLAGNSINSSAFIGKKAILFFYRGNWCPLCMAQIDEVANDYRKFDELNISTIFISPQSQKHTQKLANKYDLPFEYYFDENNLAAQQLGLLHKSGLPMGFQALGYDSDTVYPTIIAIDESGEIIYNDQTSNYRVRPEPAELLKVFYQRLI